MSQRIALTLLTSGGWTSLVVAAQECSTAGRRCQHHSQEEPASWPKPDPHQHNNLTIPAECQWAIDTLFSRQRADPTRRGDAASVTDTVWSIFKENLAGRLPSGVATPKIVDIGPRGLAMYHVYLSRFYRGSSTHYLVDRTGNGCGKAPPGSRAYHRSCAGFRTDAASFSFYTSLECAQTILVANGVRADAIRPVNATRHDVRAIGRASVDLVVSFASMGFHCSVDAYAQEIARMLKPGGSLLLTITRNDGRADKEGRAGI